MATAPPHLPETIPYPGKPYLQTHPDRLAVVARLFGVGTSDVSSCRVLEAGCGDGANLIAMAASLPGAEFTGIDLSESSIARGVALARQTGVKNVKLIVMDLCEMNSFELDASRQDFDYIVAHGVYSWVPQPVRDRLIELCAQRLGENGVAMISYATYPGGLVEQLIRDPMLFHARHFTQEKDKVDAARAFIQMTLKHAPSSALGALYQEEWDKIATNVDGFLLHDQLVEEYQPVYFIDFVRHAAAHGLQYLGEATLGDADLGARGTVGVDPAVAADVRRFAANDRVAAEQYLDFLRCRRFRQTILCRAEATVLKEPDASALRGCYAAAPSYLGSSTGLPALDAAWPGFVRCEELDADEAVLRLFAAGRIDVRTVPPLLDGGGSTRPRVTALARVQAASGGPITNLLHHQVTIEDELTRTFLTKLDGRRTRREVIEETARHVRLGEKVPLEIDRILALLGRHALLRGAE
jgi:SAM-dependent methyltransferase